MLLTGAKEARETHYWLRLLKHGEFIIKDDLLEDCDELIKLLTSIVKTASEDNSSFNIQHS